MDNTPFCYLKLSLPTKVTLYYTTIIINITNNITISSVVTVPYGDQLSKVQLVVVDLGDEDGGHGLVERRAVHVDGGAHRQHEAGDLAVHVAVLQQTLHGDGQSGRAEERTGGQ